MKDRFTSGPIVFGQLFGWYHAPVRPMRNGGVVLCNPFGYEAMCLHRCYRVLAERIAQSGIACLRFDYHGTGDSSGHDHDPDRVPAWLSSISLAVEELRRRAEVTQISLFGVRLGGTLAILSGIERQDLSSVVVWAPYLTGRSFVREMRMMQTAGAEQAFASDEERGASPPISNRGPASSTGEQPPSRRDVAPDDEEAIGYFLSASTVRELSKIDLRADKVAPAPRVLLLRRDDLPNDVRYARHLEASGAAVTDSTSTPGYSAMMQDAYVSKVPGEAFDRVVQWFGGVHTEVLPRDFSEGRATVPDLSREGPHLACESAERGAPRTAREEALMFGAGSQLLGILCEPDERQEARTSDAVIFLNVGSNHRVGSNRMYVKMARTLAAHGITSLRFDVSGIGDSISTAGIENRLYAKEAIFDAQAAMDALKDHREAERFFLVGLCSGAYLAFQTAHADPRVAGQVLINSQTFHWKDGDTLEVSLRKNYRSTRFYTTEMWNPQVWGRVLRGEVNARGIAGTLASRALERAKRGATSAFARVRTGRLEVDDVAAQFKDILKRGTETLLVFGANDGGLDQMETHLGPDAKKLEKFVNFKLEIVEGSDHTFTPLWSQDWLEHLVISTVERWRS